MTQTHTPGPWDAQWCAGTLSVDQLTVDPETDKKIRRYVCKIRGRYNSKDTLEQDKANARLIAAAPELLEALNYFFQASQHINEIGIPQGWSTDQITNFLRGAETKARAAIAKARGE